MANYERERTEERRTDENTRRYGQGGRSGGQQSTRQGGQHGGSRQGSQHGQRGGGTSQWSDRSGGSGQWSEQGGETGQWSERGNRTSQWSGSPSADAGQQPMEEYGRPTSSQSDLRTGYEGQFQESGSRGGGQSGGQTGRRSGGRMGPRAGGRGTSSLTGSETGSRSGGPGGQQSGQMGSRRTGQTGESRTTGTSDFRTGQVGGRQTGGTATQSAGGTSDFQTGQTSGRQSGRTGGSQTGGTSGGQMGGQASQQAGGPVSPVTVRDVAATDVVTVDSDAAITDVVQQMASQDVGAVVVTEGDRPAGIVTDRRIALALGDTEDVSRLRASDLMSEDLFTVPEDTSVFELARQLGGKGVRRAPVVGDEGDLRGIVSLDDVIVLLAEEFSNVSRIIRKQSPRF